MKYEYLYLREDNPLPEDEINNHSQEGWRLVSFIRTKKEFHYIFERPLELEVPLPIAKFVIFWLLVFVAIAAWGAWLAWHTAR
jgi:hypothetical protein